MRIFLTFVVALITILGSTQPAQAQENWRVTSVAAGSGESPISYVWLNFLDDPLNRIPGVSYTAKLREDLDVNLSVSYNSATERPMYFIGATWKPRK